MVDAELLRGLAAVCSIVGSVILAWRVKGMLEALSFVATMHEHNIQQLSQPAGPLVIATNATKHVENAKRFTLLLAGFFFLIASGVLNLIALFV